ncbi:MAG: response regulator transcription factor [Leptolinea sp.]|jgi:two-component system response regulator VicR|nr:response regulator transcription factor [Leptolinea sp.]
MQATILVVDDEQAVTDLLTYNLRKAGYAVRVASDGREALRLAREIHPDLILLDVMIPEIDGLDVCRELRKNSQVPVIMITARGEEVDRVVGLELGADDYVCKPFSVRELMARVKAVLRRNRSENPTVPAESKLDGPDGLQVDPLCRCASIRGDPLELTRLEFEVLYVLLQNAGRVLSRERLLELAWGYDFGGDARAVDSTVKRLRARLRSAGSDADCIEAVRGIGYRLVMK